MIENYLTERVGMQMEIPDFVIDSELFLLFSHDNSLDRIKRHFKGEFLYEDDTIAEVKSFHEVLKYMKKYKCTIVRNEPIKQDYLRIIETCDDIIKRKFMKMMATRSYWNHINETFTDDYKEEFKESVLGEKTHYVDAASQCKEFPVIVSTRECTDKYSKHDGKLLKYDVNCENICEFKNRLEKNNSNLLLNTSENNHKEREKFEFVIDSELCLLFNSINNKADDKGVIAEKKCFHEVLKKVEDGKCAIIINDDIKNNYGDILEKTCDQRFKKKFYAIITTTSYRTRCNKTLTTNDEEMFKDTMLKEKTHYVDAARQCKNYRVIISTRERTNEYFKHSRQLLEFEVNCESICEFKNSLEEDNTNNLLDTVNINRGERALLDNFNSDETLLEKLTDAMSVDFPPFSFDVGKVRNIVKSYQESKKRHP